jgi:hypothetical protein
MFASSRKQSLSRHRDTQWGEDAVTEHKRWPPPIERNVVAGRRGAEGRLLAG